MEEYWTLEEFAALCGVHPVTIYNRVNSGEIKAKIVGSATVISKDEPIVGRKKPGRKSAKEHLKNINQ